MARTDMLTDREKEVLRLVHALKTTTEIAHVLGIKEVSVNKRIDAARNKLGGISRRQAAVLLAEEEPGYENLIPSQIILPATAPPPPSGPEQGEQWTDGEPATAVISASGRRHNELDLWQRLGALLLAMAVLAAAASLYIVALGKA